MKRLGIIATLAGLALGLPVWAQPPVTLNLVTAGDQNMVDYVKDYLGPMFEKAHPGVTVRAVGTGPGDAGSQKIYEKLDAEKSNSSWDIDVAVIHQKAAGEMVTKGLLARYVGEVPTGKLVTSEAAKRALGTDVDGFVLPMFNSQTAIAYNTAIVKEPPKPMPSWKNGSNRTRKNSATTASRAACRGSALSSAGSMPTPRTPTG
jgi:spermidine/putrescine-binding protein